jgi:hypothetical protein
MQLVERGESGVDLALRARLQDRELHPLCARRFRQISDHGLSTRIVRVHQHGDYPGLGNQFGNQIDPLRYQVDVEDADAGDVATRAGKTVD